MIFKKAMVLVSLLISSSLSYAGHSFADQCTPDPLISDPVQFEWTYTESPEPHYYGTMEIAEADLVINGETITTRVYRQEGGCNSIPGPTVTMIPGNKYVMKFRNLLAYEPKSEEHNVFRDPNVSNLHTHGLHISGESPGDDVTRSFEGQAGGDFVYDIPADHMGGTFWYHAHHHGSTYLQVSAGAFGLMVIDDQFDGIPQRVEDMEERQLVVAYLDPAVAGTGGDTLISGSLSPTWTVNGQVNGTMEVPNGTWHHWRVLLADRDAKAKTFSVGAGCEIALMARDGVWRTEVPKLLPTNSISLTGASRADLAVNCTASSSISVGGQQVASINVDESIPDNGPSPFNAADTTWFSKRPNYLQDLRNQTPNHQDTINMGARTVAGSKWDHAVPNFTLETNGVQEFKLKGATNHPFHLHIYHVQVQGDCGDFEDGEYYDVVAGNCTIRFDLTPDTAYLGRTVMHCHILEHEDQGAMGWADVLGGKLPPVFPDNDDDPTNGPYYDYYAPVIGPADPPAAPTGLVATAASSSSIDLSWTDNSNNELYFKIERSGVTNPLTYVPVNTVDADVTSYSDPGLEAFTKYFYRVIASNNDGDSGPSNEVSATTLEAGVPTALLLGSITVSTVSEGKGQKRPRAVVAVTDNNGVPFQGAVVTGDFSGSITQNGVTATTDANGIATLDTDSAAKGGVSFEFCVTSIVDPGSILAPYTIETCASL
jgi:FtsP/CotA-like multicopper oxidase with cupredoxin domain